MRFGHLPSPQNGSLVPNAETQPLGIGSGAGVNELHPALAVSTSDKEDGTRQRRLRLHRSEKECVCEDG